MTDDILDGVNEINDVKPKEIPAPLITPKWIIGDNKIDEPLFCEEFLKIHKLLCINGNFLGFNGVVDDSVVRACIYDMIKPFVNIGISRKINQLLTALKFEAYSAELIPDGNMIHLLNGTYYLNGAFTTEKKICHSRLQVAYNPDAPNPTLFRDFLNDLLYPDDILTLQEWIGYCMTTAPLSRIRPS